MTANHSKMKSLTSGLHVFGTPRHRRLCRLLSMFNWIIPLTNQSSSSRGHQNIRPDRINRLFFPLSCTTRDGRNAAECSVTRLPHPVVARGTTNPDSFSDHAQTQEPLTLFSFSRVHRPPTFCTFSPLNSL
jgi:hypothetical protein